MSFLKQKIGDVFMTHPLFLSLRKNSERISVKFAGGNDCILGNIGTGTRENAAATEYLNRRQSVLPRCQTDAEA